MNLSIRWKLLLAIALPITIIYLVVLFFDYLYLKENAYRNTELYLQEVVEHSAEKFHAEFSTAAQVARSTAQFLSGNPKVSEKELYETVVTNVAQSPFIYGSCIAFEPKEFNRRKKLFAPYAWRGEPTEANPSGIQTMDIGNEAYDYQEWEWYDEPRRLDKPVWTPPYFDEGAGDIIMTTYSAPFYKKGKLLGIAPLDAAADLATDIAADIATLGQTPKRRGRFWGIATIDINLEKLQKTSREKLIEGAAFVILDKDGTIISHPEKEYIMKKNIFEIVEGKNRTDVLKFTRQLLSGDKGILRVEDFPYEGDNFVVYAPVPSTSWVFVISVPESLIMKRAWTEITQFSIFMLASLVVIVFVILLISFHVTRPIRKLSAQMHSVGEGNLEIAKKEKFPNDEIGNLGNNFYKMVADLKNYTNRLEKETKARESVESELRIARNIQTSLIPRTFPPFPTHKEFDLHARNAPAQYVAGDFYDYFFVSDDEIVIVIADVSGHGVAAALFMAVIRTLIRNAASHSMDPAETLDQVNQTAAEENVHGLFVTLTLSYYNVQTGKIRYASAGHPPAYLIKKDGKATQATPPTGTLLGVFPHIHYKTGELKLGSGEAIIFYTDGVTEARDEKGTFWGYENLQKTLEAMKELPAKRVCDQLCEKVFDYQKDHLGDDVTVVVLKRNF